MTHSFPTRRSSDLWLNLSNNDFERFMPVATKGAKAGGRGEWSIFKLFSLGVVTARDEWVFDVDQDALQRKVSWLISKYNEDVAKFSTSMGQTIAASELDSSIKWSRAVKRDLSKGVKYEYNDVDIVETMYRPFVKRHLYFNRSLNEVQYQLPSMLDRKSVV